MAFKELVVALSMIVAASPVSAALPQPAREASAPTAEPGARYCLRVEPVTVSWIESIKFETRDAWAELEIDVYKEWADNGVRVIA